MTRWRKTKKLELTGYKQPGHLKKLLQLCAARENTSDRLIALLPKYLAKDVYNCQINRNTLRITVFNNSAAAILKFSSVELLKTFSKHSRTTLSRLEVKIHGDPKQRF